MGAKSSVYRRIETCLGWVLIQCGTKMANTFRLHPCVCMYRVCIHILWVCMRAHWVYMHMNVHKKFRDTYFYMHTSTQGMHTHTPNTRTHTEAWNHNFMPRKGSFTFPSLISVQHDSHDLASILCKVWGLIRVGVVSVNYSNGIGP